MFLSMLFATRAGLGAVTNSATRRLTQWTLGVMVLGGLLLGPAVQKVAFGDWWTGIPFGHDLTDNKTLIAVAAWVWAAWRQRRGRSGRWSVLAAAVVTMAIFAIPHSVWGSEIDWEALPVDTQTPAP